MVAQKQVTIGKLERLKFKCEFEVRAFKREMHRIDEFEMQLCLNEFGDFRFDVLAKNISFRLK